MAKNKGDACARFPGSGIEQCSCFIALGDGDDEFFWFNRHDEALPYY
jgi:hypothetical protein